MHLSGEQSFPFSVPVEINISDTVKVRWPFDVPFDEGGDARSAQPSDKESKFKNDILPGSFSRNPADQRPFVVGRDENNSEGCAFGFFLEFQKQVAASIRTRVQNDWFEPYAT
jgi:hypothetical protein